MSISNGGMPGVATTSARVRISRGGDDKPERLHLPHAGRGLGLDEANRRGPGRHDLEMRSTCLRGRGAQGVGWILSWIVA
jgi:hypothetical protein